MRKTIIGMLLFLVQISLALFYNSTIDLILVAGAAALVFIYILYKYFTKQYAQ